jgi:TldD protein
MILKQEIMKDVLNIALSTGGSFAEIFAEDRYNQSVSMLGGDVESAIAGRDYGVGIRIFNGLNSIFVHTNDASRGGLMRLAKDAADAVEGVDKQSAMDLVQRPVHNMHTIKRLPGDVQLAKKVALLQRANAAASTYDDLISQVSVSYGDVVQNVLIANSEGLLVEDRRIRTRMGISVVAMKDGEMQSGFLGPGASMGFEFYDTLDIEATAKEAARIAVTMVKAPTCPSGQMPVIIDNKFGGVLFHEACGHGLEATSVAKGLSVFNGKVGQKVASELVTAIDDGTIPNAWGSLNIDDEGAIMQKRVLIKDGILQGYMIDKLNGLRMNAPSTASGRRASYSYAPTSRMTNTYIAAGQSKKEDIIAGTEYGLYAKSMGGGSVNPGTGEFNFSVMEGYIIKDGKIDRPVRGATLIGKGIEILGRIDRVGDNLDHAQGMCGSQSGSIPTNVGQPTIRISSMTVGGREQEA